MTPAEISDEVYDRLARILIAEAERQAEPEDEAAAT